MVSLLTHLRVIIMEYMSAQGHRVNRLVWIALLLACVCVAGANAHPAADRGPGVLTTRAVTNTFLRAGIPLTWHHTFPLRGPFHGATLIATGSRHADPFADRSGFAVDAWVFLTTAEARAEYTLVYGVANNGSGGSRGIRIRNVLIDVYLWTNGQVNQLATMKRLPAAVLRAQAVLR